MKKEEKNRKNNKILKKLIWIFLIVLEALSAFMFAAQMPRGVTNIGAFFGLFMSLAALIATIFITRVRALLKKLWGKKAGKTVIIAFFSVFGLLTMYAVILSALMTGEILNAPKNPQAVIVLGCRVQKDGRPSLMLRRRLEAAYEYLKENEEIICVTAGGQGEDEPASEGETMKKALVEMGISGDRIIVEDKSVNTEENLALSAKLLEDMGIEGGEVTIVSDGFHLYRASIFAERAGLETTSISAETPWYMAAAYWVREWFALSAVFVFG